MLPVFFEIDAIASMIWNMLWPMQTNAWITQNLQKNDPIAYVMLRWHRNLDAPLFRELCLRAKFDVLSSLASEIVLEHFAKDMRFDFLTDVRFLPTLRRFLHIFTDKDNSQIYRIYQTKLPIELGIAIGNTPELTHLTFTSILCVRFMFEGDVENLKICLDLPYNDIRLKTREKWMFSYLDLSLRDKCWSEAFYLDAFGHGGVLSLEMLSFLCSDCFQEFQPLVVLKSYFSNLNRDICPNTLDFLYHHEIIRHEDDCARFFEFVIQKNHALIDAFASILLRFMPKDRQKLSSTIDFLLAQKNIDVVCKLLFFTSTEQRKTLFLILLKEDMDIAVSLWRSNSLISGKQFLELFTANPVSEQFHTFLRRIDFDVDDV